jgi:outer membrane protein OmpA-like peptidoglycan-associated protein
VRCAFHDQACIAQAKADGKTPVMTDADGNLMTDEQGRPMTDPAAAAVKAGASGQRPGTGAWANYDFIPGDKMLFVDDFSRDNVGDFPRRWNLLAGNWEVVEWQGGRYLRATSPGAVRIDLPATLPERFTIEFPVSVQHGNGYLRVSTAPVYHGDRSYAGSLPNMQYATAGLLAQKGKGPTISTNRPANASRDTLVTMRIMADGAYMKVYLNDQRVANAPNAVFARTSTLFFSGGSVYDEAPILVGPMRVAAGGLDLYDALARDGRVSTQGILFAVNSDVIRPESTPTLKEIGAMLNAHADLRLTIEGHTDTDGDDAYNLGLSQRRAAAVKSFIVSAYGVAGNRLATEGYGENRPVADNSTPEGKQQNRRVELVRQGS